MNGQNEKFIECKEQVVNRAYGRCQICGKKLDNLKIYFESHDAMEKCDPVRAVCLCNRHFEIAMNLYNAFEMQREFAERRK